MATPVLCRWLATVDTDDVEEVGGKNASLGEMIRDLSEAGVDVPDGFATTAAAYRTFLAANDIEDAIAEQLARLDEGDPVEEVGGDIRDLLESGEIPDEVRQAITEHYRELGRRAGDTDLPVAVRSSATAEDLPDASFAGQQETFLDVAGEDAVLDACRLCFASLFTDRAIAYRMHHGFDHLDVALSVGVQRMIRSGEGNGAAGVMFSVDTETGFPHTVVIDAAWGLGESVVAGSVDPDEYVVFKPLLDDDHARPILARRRGSKASKVVTNPDGSEPSTEETTDDERSALVLTDDEVLALARDAMTIERHYDRPMDMEWARDRDGGLFIVQARPETVQTGHSHSVLRTATLEERSAVVTTGSAIGQGIAVGEARVVTSPVDAGEVPDGIVLVTAMTDPDWVPLMKQAAAIVTDHGGRTSHAAIVSRELGLPAIVGTGDATSMIGDGDEVTVSCAEGDRGTVYEGRLSWDEQELALDDIPATRTRVMLNLAAPEAALRWWPLPAAGVGLARMEFVVGNHIGVHPMAAAHPEAVGDDVRSEMAGRSVGHESVAEWFVDRLASGIALLAASRHPDPVIVRMSDFKTNEYASLLGGAGFEPDEQNPMLGWRGASRYHQDDYRDGFALECRAIRRVREAVGLTNVVVMIPFCRTLEEADAVLETLAAEGLVRGRDGLEVYVMAEVPSNVILAEEFAARFDGLSIGSNDLTQLVLGVDRDSDKLGDLFDESDPAVRAAIAAVIDAGHAGGATVGLCGQAPSDDPGFARFLVECGIDSISVTPDSFVAVVDAVATAERDDS